MGSVDKWADICFLGGGTWQYEKNWHEKTSFYVELETQF